MWCCGGVCVGFFGVCWVGCYGDGVGVGVYYG